MAPLLTSAADTAKVLGTQNGNIRNLVAGYTYAVGKYNPSDPKYATTLATTQSGIISAVDKNVQDLIDRATMASTRGGQIGAYRSALGVVTSTQAAERSLTAADNRIPGTNKKQNNEALAELLGLTAKERQTAVSDYLNVMQTQTQLQSASIGGIGPQADLKRAQATLTGLRGQLAQARSINADWSTIAQLKTQVDQQAVTVLQDQVNSIEQMGQALSSYRQGATADPIQQAQISIGTYQQEYQQLIAAGDKNQADIWTVLGQIRQQVLQKVSSQISQEQAQAQAQLSQANIGQPQQVTLANAVSSAQQQLAYIKSLPSSQVAPGTLFQALNSLYQAQGALVQFQIQQGQQFIQAESQLQQGKTFDPVQAANIALQGAQRLLAYDVAHNQPAATLEQDKASIAQSYKSKMEASWQKQIATTEYLAATYKITGQQEIANLQKILATMEKAHASYTDIQQVAQQLFNLEFNASGALNLNTAAMHMPSTYEVKSAIRGAAHGARLKMNEKAVAQMKNDFNMTINVYKTADARKVVDMIHQSVGSSLQTLGQAAGLI